MPKYRQLHKKILDSDDFNEIPDDFTRVIWMLLPLILDGEGRGLGSMAWVKAQLFPKRVDNIETSQVAASMNWLAQRHMLIFYSVNGKNYFYVPTFKDYQSHTEREAKSILPEPPPQELPGLIRTNQDLPAVAVQELPSVAVYESESASESESILKDKPKLFSIRDAEKAYLQVTGFVAVPGGLYEYLEKILDMLQHYGWDETINRLTRALTDWKAQTRKDNHAHYKTTNPKWIDNAIADETIGISPISEVDRVNQEINQMAKRNQ
jgi:hypothetical protein